MSTLKRVRFNSQLILTTEQLAEFYDTNETSIKQNFNNNREKFVEGKHYFWLNGDDLKAFKNKVENFDLVGKNANQLYLWTKRGAARHSKMLGTDRAWDMFDELEEKYFNPQDQLPQTPEEKIQLLLENSGSVNEKLKIFDQRVKTLEDDQSLSPSEYSYLSRRVNHKVAEYISVHNLKPNRKQRSRLFKDISSGLNEVTNVQTRIQIRKKDFETASKFIESWAPSIATVTIISQLGSEIVTAKEA